MAFLLLVLECRTCCIRVLELREETPSSNQFFVLMLDGEVGFVGTRERCGNF